jgi:hypothetical protein
MFNLEQSIAAWRKEMLVAGIKPESLDELENHLREEFEEQIKLNGNEIQAFEIAVQQIGRAQMLKQEFRRSESAKDAAIQMVKNYADLGFLIIMAIAVALTFRFALEWQPVATMITHDGSVSHPILNQISGQPWGEETGMMQSVCLAELLLLSLILSLAAAFHMRRSPQNLKRLKLITRIGQWCGVFWGLKIISSGYPFWALVMALMSYLVFVIILRWQSRLPITSAVLAARAEK